MAGSDKEGQPGSNGPASNKGDWPTETAAQFHYDALDGLIGRTTSAGKEQRFYRNDELANEVSGTVSTTFVRAEGVVLAEHQTGGDLGPMLLVGDDKNSVLGELTQQGLKGIAYSPYGHRTDEALASSHLGYNGERRERQTGWYLLGNGYRVFNPRLMRFHSPDSLSPFGKGGLNAYMYCVGDPVNSVDLTGHFAFSKGGFLRLFRKTTASSVAKNIPEDLKKRPEGKSASLFTITKTHVGDLDKRQMVAYHDAKKAVRELNEFMGSENISSEGLTMKWKQIEKSVAEASSARQIYDFSVSNLKKYGITRHSADAFRDQAKKYHSSMKVDVAKIDADLVKAQSEFNVWSNRQRNSNIREGGLRNVVSPQTNRLGERLFFQ
ncbi:RHS repeat-associated core domain-containing protein [Pseudomonas sp. SMN5]|uniref:RHS repeat-associated core domain-containing protein n=1 Tax=Pseudomonas sp. SMN5 TaxID=3390198 RepID=UPI003F843F08